MADTIACALLVLAAGGSARMGRPKQLLLLGTQPLLRTVTEAALRAPVSPVIVVLGANADKISPTLHGLPVRTVINANWAEGLGSSVRTGMADLAAIAPDAQTVIIALGDQPDLTAVHLGRLIESHRVTGRSIVASVHDKSPMPPVLFSARHFPELRALRGDVGARALLRTHRAELATVPLAVASDLDTPADYEAYLSRLSGRP